MQLSRNNRKISRSGYEIYPPRHQLRVSPSCPSYQAKAPRFRRLFAGAISATSLLTVDSDATSLNHTDSSFRLGCVSHPSPPFPRHHFLHDALTLSAPPT